MQSISPFSHDVLSQKDTYRGLHVVCKYFEFEKVYHTVEICL